MADTLDHAHEKFMDGKFMDEKFMLQLLLEFSVSSAGTTFKTSQRAPSRSVVNNATAPLINIRLEIDTSFHPSKTDTSSSWQPHVHLGWRQVERA